MHIFCVLNAYKRLDSALQEILDSKRNQVAQLIESKCVFVNGVLAKKSRPLKKGDEISVDFSQNYIKSNCQDSNDFKNLKIEIIHESRDFVILNKPQNLVVHTAPSVKEPTLCDYLKARNFTLSNLAGSKRLGIVHRLDKDTSGAILVAKNNRAHAHFSELLRQRKMGRIYLCVVSPPLKENAVIELFLGRNPQNRLKMAALSPLKHPRARDSKSEFRKVMISDDGRFELLSVRLFSGRTHQIRVHLDSINRHIYGDSLYSPANLAKSYKCKMLLHATLLYFGDFVDSKDSKDIAQDSKNLENLKNSHKEVFFAPLSKDFIAFLESNFTNYKEILEKHLNEWKIELLKQDSTESTQVLSTAGSRK